VTTEKVQINIRDNNYATSNSVQAHLE